MPITMPPVKQVPSPNYSPRSISHDLFIYHMMEGGYLGSVAWLCRPATRAAAHLCTRKDGGEVTQLVGMQFESWAECNFNPRGASLEIEGFTAQGMSEQTMRAAALIGGWYCRAYGVPPAWAPNGAGRGLAQHHDLGAAGGGHVDCSAIGSDTWLKLVAYTKEAFDAFGDDPLPPFALHGAPGPHQVELPPAVAPEASHGGAPRAQPNDTHEHATASSYPRHSLAAMQFDLNAVGVSPRIEVDGLWGDETRAALVAFQRSHGLAPDGQIGPLTWAAIDKASS